MTTKDGYYGSDGVENRFSDPKTNEAYFTLINEKTGEIEVLATDLKVLNHIQGTLPFN